jgi:hypothetical protein
MDRRLGYKPVGRRHPDESCYKCCDTEKEEVVVETGWLPQGKLRTLSYQGLPSNKPERWYASNNSRTETL